MRVVRMFAALVMTAGMALVGGCGSESSGGSGSTGGSTGGAAHTTAAARRAPTDPAEQLVTGIRALNSATFRVVEKTVLSSVTTTSEGATDPARRAIRITQSTAAAGKTTKTEIVAFGTDIYLRYDVPAVPGLPAGTWAYVDGRRVRSLQAVGLGSDDDPSGKLALVEAVTAIERTGSRQLRGTFDLSKGASTLSGLVDALGTGAKSAPWQARFDSEDRLEWLSVTISATGDVPAYTGETTYSAFGEPVSVERPPVGATVEAPESLYKFFGR